jgi:geranyl-CoA carboxylase alpha subunit
MHEISPLLIANRGEIAIRIARTARRLGVRSVAIHSVADNDSPHLQAADIAMAIGGEMPTKSYLDGPAIIAAAQRAGARAVHPGYGFLAENALFAEAVLKAGLIFIGPPPAAIAAMGDKGRARARVGEAGIAILPGYDGADQSLPAMRDAAAAIGYPVMIKAAAGGGGRGMRLLERPEDLAAALRAATAEAETAFGDGRLILERALIAPRHIEIQIFADHSGNCIHLGERDCSIQRRHQKIIEEAPSPVLDERQRAAMGEAAIAIARLIGYVGAGTVEFLRDRNGKFYFMEMNTRLQVEHPVTELLTGIDLVEWQLRIACGEDLPLREHEVRSAGHAIEVRLCAEDPADGFMPRTGRVLCWEAGPGVRSEAALAEGLAILPHYDPMLAKLIAHAPDRAQAIARLTAALAETTLLGVATNRAFLLHILRDPAFVAGDDVSTAFIATHFPDDTSRATPLESADWALAAWLSVAASTIAAGWEAPWRGWSNALPLPRPWRLIALGPRNHEREGRIACDRGGAIVHLDGEEIDIRGVPAAARAQGVAEIGGRTVDYRFAWADDKLWLKIGEKDLLFWPQSRIGRAAAGAHDHDGALRAPMTARVIAMQVALGDRVEEGQAMLSLEAMKMEITVTAPRSGNVMRLDIAPGDQVTLGQILAFIGKGDAESARG